MTLFETWFVISILLPIAAMAANTAFQIRRASFAPNHFLDVLASLALGHMFLIFGIWMVDMRGWLYWVAIGQFGMCAYYLVLVGWRLRSLVGGPWYWLSPR